MNTNASLSKTARLFTATVGIAVATSLFAPSANALSSLPGSNSPTTAATNSQVASIGGEVDSTSEFLSSDGSWSVRVPNSWRPENIGSNGQSMLFSHNGESAFTFSISAAAAPIGSPSRYLREQVASLQNNRRVISKQEIKKIKGMSVVRLGWYQADSPENRNAEVLFFRNTGPSTARVIYLRASMVRSLVGSEVREAELNAILSSLKIRS
jgi:hypothetical protein